MVAQVRSPGLSPIFMKSGNNSPDLTHIAPPVSNMSAGSNVPNMGSLTSVQPPVQNGGGGPQAFGLPGMSNTTALPVPNPATMGGMSSGQTSGSSPAMGGSPELASLQHFGLQGVVNSALGTPKPYGANDFGVHPDVGQGDVADRLMHEIGRVETGGQASPYTTKASDPKSTASGKYQYINSKWDNYGGYAHAMDAPPEVQEQRMRSDVMDNLNRFQGDPFKAAAAHYMPARADDPSTWNNPVVDKHGKEIKGAPTVADYVGRVVGPQRVASYLSSTSGRDTGRQSSDNPDSLQ